MAELAELAAKGRAKADKQKQKNMDRDRARQSKALNLTGKGARSKPEYSRAMKSLERSWRSGFEAANPGIPLPPWDGKQRGQVGMLIEKYQASDVDVLLRFATQSWGTVRAQIKKSPLVPTLGYLLSLHDGLMPMALKWDAVVGVKTEWDSWWEKHPSEDPPDELEERFNDARTELLDLGLI